MRLKIRPMLLIAERAMPMDLQSAATTATAPVADNTGRLRNVLVRCNNAPTTPPTLGTRSMICASERATCAKLPFLRNALKNFHCSDGACGVA